MLMLPVWTAWGPRAALRVLPAQAAPAANRAIPAASVVSAEMPAAAVHLESRQPATRSTIWNWCTCLAGLYLLGVAVLLARLAIGTIRAHRLMRSAVHHAGTLTSPSCAAPITVGWLRPTVILPECWREWPRKQLEAVLAHEREHARRRDPLVEWLALLNRALFWFHPLAWYLEWRLSGLAEEACDAAVLAQGHDPYEYSNYLLEIAQSVMRSGERVHVWGMAMPGSFLTRRIRQILEGRPAPRLTRARMASASVACAVLSAVFAAGAVDRRPAAPATAMAQMATGEAPVPVRAAAPRPSDTRSNPAPRPKPALIAQVQSTPQPSSAATPQPQPSKDRRMLTMYFDLAELTEADLTRAVAAAQRFVRTQMQPRDQVAIMTHRSGGKPTVVQDFTGDADTLVQTLQKLTGEPAASSGEVSSADGRSTALRAGIQILRPLDTKKALIVFVAGPAIGPVAEEQRQARQVAIDADVALYLVDVRGLVAPPR